MTPFLCGMYIGGGLLFAAQMWASHCTGRVARYDRLHWKIGFAVVSGALWLPIVVTKALVEAKP